MQAIAREYGWSIAVHGSMVRDYDLIAVPWTKDAVHWRVLHAALMVRTPLDDAEGNLLGQHRGPFGRIKALALQPGCVRGEPHPKGIWLPPAIDLSFMDPRDNGFVDSGDPSWAEKSAPGRE